ncbi:hypothetical protein SOVF_180540 [Spinacia oleracea]|uniref:Ribosomal protein S1, mitochondrial-like n=1 Tax=Spinacia oleracea TaxID=3562 RepID=A0A9R0JFW2_SPIOL|nr:ribosomal protein S1, mitochondrial-like [Spinacia oleracea]KNA06498.1 hypothetical protein SOVF_180540 [Spinacia oleracea]
MSRLLELSRRVTPASLLKPTLPPPISTTSSSTVLHHRSANLLSHYGLAIGSMDSKPSQSPNILPRNAGKIRLYSSTSEYSGSKHSAYMNQLYPMSNSSFKLSSGNSLQANIVRLSEEVFLVDSGIGTPRICLQDELIGVKNKEKIRFENRVGFLDLVTGESHINKQILERFFIDLVAGDSTAKERATERFNDLVGGSADVNAVAAGEPLLVLPRRYRQKRAWMELKNKYRSNLKVKGFIVGKVRGGYSVAIAGFVAFLPFRSSQISLTNDLFLIEKINHKTGNIMVSVT